MVPGFVGKPKGMKQIIWERGLWRPGMVRSRTESEIKRILLQDGVPPADNMYWRLVLILLLKSLHCKQWWKRAVTIFIYSMPCHPVLAGVGMAYGWGCSKK
jgi:hypothetical protein